MPNNSNDFVCDKCNFKCNKQCNFNKHLLTAKHKMFENAGEKRAENALKYECLCGKHYKHNQSYYRHKKDCNFTQFNNSSLVNATILDLISQNKELMKLLMVQNEEHKEETK